MPNPWDAGSARLLQQAGFAALATTSSGHAASLGKLDQHVTLDELVAHVAVLTAAVEVPVSVDAERGFADEASGLTAVVDRLADAGAAGLSIEDFDPAAKAIDPLAVAVERVGVAAEAAHRHGMVLTARAENLLYLAGDLADTIARLQAYRDAGADAVYAPGLVDLAEIARVVSETGVPVNVLARPGGPTVLALGGVGVRRVSTGGTLAWNAYGELVRAAEQLAADGTVTAGLSPRVRSEAFGG